MMVFVFFQRDRLSSSVPSVNALSKPSASVLDDRQRHNDLVHPISDTTMSIESTRNLQLALEPSHSHITDSQALVVVEEMSGYEVQNLLRQAQYGDEDSAFTLGMAYEIGHYVPQSCAQAAKWVAVAAAEGKPAAQYNLGIRQAYGDGTPTNLKEAKKWIREAAGHGYKKAERAMEAMGGVR
jgi:TPR repeat protein